MNHYEQMMDGNECNFAYAMGHFNRYVQVMAGNECNLASGTVYFVHYVLVMGTILLYDW